MPRWRDPRASLDQRLGKEPGSAHRRRAPLPRAGRRGQIPHVPRTERRRGAGSPGRRTGPRRENAKSRNARRSSCPSHATGRPAWSSSASAWARSPVSVDSERLDSGPPGSTPSTHSRAIFPRVSLRDDLASVERNHAVQRRAKNPALAIPPLRSTWNWLLQPVSERGGSRSGSSRRAPVRSRRDGASFRESSRLATRAAATP